MNPPEAQSDSDSQETYFDPEAVDSSEQFFSASLESVGSRPAFVVEPTETSRSSGSGAKVEQSTQREPGLSEREGPGRNSAEGASHSETPPVLAEGSDHQDGTSAALPDRQSDWRDLVSAKVKHYKTLKPRKERYPSLQLQFNSAPSWTFESHGQSRESNITSFVVQPEPPPVPEPEPSIFFQPTTESTARVLEFPRSGMLPFNRDELAEPVIDRPRIVEAPELLPPPPALGGILIEQAPAPEPERQPGIDMPLHTARLARKLFAAVVDGIVISAALSIFGYLFVRFTGSLPEPRTSAMLIAGLTLILWFGYQYSFLTFCGTTIGLRAARLRLLRFDGSPARRSVRRWRVVTSVLSAISLGLGYAWCFFDEDQLSWHDRITKTHLAPR